VKELRGGVAVITGAASGIGRALALELAAEGMTLALADCDAPGLAETVQFVSSAAATASQHVVDVADEAAVNAFALDVLRVHGRVDVVVNNAGVSIFGSVLELSTAEIAWLMGVNFWGVVHGTKAFLPALLSRPEACLVNISSVFGLWGPPGQTAYAASKFAVRGFTESLRAELSGTNVRVVTVHPGGVKTAIARSARVAAGADPAKAAALTARFDREFLTMPPQVLAARIVDAIKHRRAGAALPGARAALAQPPRARLNVLRSSERTIALRAFVAIHCNEMLTANIVARLAKLDTCSVSDGLDSLGLRGATYGIVPAWPCGRVAGIVRTMKIKPAGREQSTRHLGVAAIAAADASSVIVIDAGGRTDISAWGGLLSLAARKKDVRGVIVDGSCRDIDDAAEAGFPVFSRGAVPMTARGRVMEASTDEEITIAGLVVRPGDYVVADRSGIVFVPSESAIAVLDAAEAFALRERKMAQALLDGGDVVAILGGSEYERMLEHAPD
jgi:NAD(P)-dependent dehydrogenase (short-subunit alcohol dehydrogenase family)/regulator of RNase E activity RraA